MNFHSDEWILNQVNEHYKEAKTLINPSHIVGVFYQGSGNYGLDYEGSDVDTKCIITPDFKEIALNRKPLSTTHIRKNEEHIDLKDIRLYIQTFRKQNLNFLEILFTPYTIFPNEKFLAQWNPQFILKVHGAGARYPKSLFQENPALCYDPPAPEKFHFPLTQYKFSIHHLF